MSIRYIYTNN
jgi:multisubunit Na+/H+ antiporter MnhF subunit